MRYHGRQLRRSQLPKYHPTSSRNIDPRGGVNKMRGLCFLLHLYQTQSTVHHATVVSQGPSTRIFALDSSSRTEKKKSSCCHWLLLMSLIFFLSFSFFSSAHFCQVSIFAASFGWFLSSVSWPLALNMTKRDSFTANFASPRDLRMASGHDSDSLMTPALSSNPAASSHAAAPLMTPASDGNQILAHPKFQATATLLQQCQAQCLVGQPLQFQRSRVTPNFIWPSGDKESSIPKPSSSLSMARASLARWSLWWMRLARWDTLVSDLWNTSSMGSLVM